MQLIPELKIHRVPVALFLNRFDIVVNEQ